MLVTLGVRCDHQCCVLDRVLGEGASGVCMYHDMAHVCTLFAIEWLYVRHPILSCVPLLLRICAVLT